MFKKVVKIFGALILVSLVMGDSFAVQVYPRIFSPNGDGANDKVIFQIENPAMLPLNGEIFDMSGAKVGDLIPGPIADLSLIWDGKLGGTPVPSGIYIYRVEVGNKSVTGTVVVVK